MSFEKDNADYEAWLETQCSVVTADLERKHRRMRGSAFVFLRATYFRWAKRVVKVCDDLSSSPEVLAVGDIHLENYGTWRDAEGRLVWGVNDFDEAAVMPYAFDLVRLATSVRLAPGLASSAARTCDALLLGYGQGLRNPRPTILDERAVWMRPRVACSDLERDHFWREIEDLPPASPPENVVATLMAALPTGSEDARFAARTRGGGSLGRPRFVAVATWRGGKVVREAKALVPSAWTWVHNPGATTRPLLDIACGIHRSRDPFLSIANQFIVRRLSADARKIDLGSSGAANLEERMLSAMGADLAAIHAAEAGKAEAIAKHLEKQPDDWLRNASGAMALDVEKDFRSYRDAAE